MELLEKHDIQGFLLRGYGKMRHTRYSLLHITDAALVRPWMATISNALSDGNYSPDTSCLNLALTAAGLSALGLKPENVRNFAREFREGMAEPHRQRILGDLGSNSPDHWQWGNKDAAHPLNDTQIHLMLMFFGKDESSLHELYAQYAATFEANGFKLLLNLDGQIDKDNKEHFGFRDGIAQPVIAGSGLPEPEGNTVAAGEFILGYKNEYGVLPDSPTIQAQFSQGDMNLLPTGQEGTKDLGRNGTYLVYRQMQQHVDRFWNFMRENTRQADGDVDEEASIRLAAKMVGRWPSGAPLVQFPDKDPGGLSDLDSFGYHESDRAGLKCPIGSHIRRTNPRDAFEQNSAQHSLKLTNKHRILRRGRSYNTEIDGEPELGLHFMCFNADISKQFEFVQHTWANFPRFEHLYNDPDPIIGTADHALVGEEQNFTVQQLPVNQCIRNLEPFVTMRGGAYFFFPSLTAIRFLASL